MKKYSNLQSLILNNTGARKYYNELPSQIRKLVDIHGDQVNSLGTLIDYAENKLRLD